MEKIRTLVLHVELPKEFQPKDQFIQCDLISKSEISSNMLFWVLGEGTNKAIKEFRRLHPEVKICKAHFRNLTNKAISRKRPLTLLGLTITQKYFKIHYLAEYEILYV